MTQYSLPSSSPEDPNAMSISDVQDVIHTFSIAQQIASQDTENQEVIHYNNSSSQSEELQKVLGTDLQLLILPDLPSVPIDLPPKTSTTIWVQEVYDISSTPSIIDVNEM